MREFVGVDVGAPPPGPGPRAPPHLTLRFLGEVAPTRNAEIELALTDVARSTSAFVLRIEGVGAFPDAIRPRVVWVGVTRGRPELMELARRVRAALEPAFGRERDDFVPHLTLFRVRSPSDHAAATELLAGRRPAPPPREVVVDELQLKESILGPGGAEHRTVAKFPLAGPSEPP